MKKNLFYYLFAVICSVSLFTSCSDDDDEKVVCPVGETTFTDKSGLQLTYSSAPNVRQNGSNLFRRVTRRY